MGGLPSSSEPVGVVLGVPFEPARALAGKNARVAERRSRRENGRSPAETRPDRSSAEDVFVHRVPVSDRGVFGDWSVSDGASSAASSREGATSISRWPSSMSRFSEPRSLFLGYLRKRSPVSLSCLAEIEISSVPADAKPAATEADRVCPDRVDV
jgi:hypothetical protein